MRNPSPIAYAASTLLVGLGLAVSGIYLLAGLGWSLMASSVPFLAFGFVVFRGVLAAQRLEDENEVE